MSDGREVTVGEEGKVGKVSMRVEQRMLVVVRHPLMSIHSPVKGSKDVELSVEEADRLEAIGLARA